VIIRPTAQGLLCIRQMDHARLAGELARAWGGKSVVELVPGESVLFAIGNHDAGWPELDDGPRWNPATKAPHTYRSHPLEDALAVADRSVTRVAAADPYAGWLVSRHFASFHQDDDDPRAAGWVVEQVGRRAEMLSHARPRVPREALHPHVLEANFDWLQLFDALSLALCEDWNEWQSRPMALLYGETSGRWRYEQIATGTAGETLFVRGRLDPWPFASPTVTARVQGRLLGGTEWRDSPSLGAAWQVAPLVTVEAALSRG
jgi:uncharacterized protein DUF3891